MMTRLASQLLNKITRCITMTEMVFASRLYHMEAHRSRRALEKRSNAVCCVVTVVVWIRRSRAVLEEGGAVRGRSGEAGLWAGLGTEIDSATSFVNTRLRSAARASGGPGHPTPHPHPPRWLTNEQHPEIYHSVRFSCKASAMQVPNLK